MEKNANCHGPELPQELLISFAKAMAPEIKMFYQSDAGKTYYDDWLKRHPQYRKNGSAHSTGKG